MEAEQLNQIAATLADLAARLNELRSFLAVSSPISS